MKAILHILLAAGILAVLGWALKLGFAHRAEAAADQAQAPEAKEAAPAKPEKGFTVKLSKEQHEALDVQVIAPAKASLKPQRLAFGHVLSPSSLITLDSDLAAEEAALRASKAEHERAQTLLAAGQNVSQKAAEAAEAQFRADEIKLRSARRAAAMEWGAEFAEMDAQARSTLVASLVKGEAALVRADVLPSEAISDVPLNARLLVLGREEMPITTGNIIPAYDTDASTQAQGFILRVEKPPFVLRPGMALTAYFELAGEAQQGVTVPRAAILRHDGQTWVYVRTDEETEYVRKPVKLGAPKNDGWFIADGLTSDDKVVIEGASVLLSEELKAAGGAAEE